MEIGSRIIKEIRVFEVNRSSEAIARISLLSHGFDEPPYGIIHDRDPLFIGSDFKRMIKSSGIKDIKIPPKAPKCNSHVERLIGSIRRECTDHFIFFTTSQLQATMDKYKDYYNNHRPHQGISQKIPNEDKKNSDVKENDLNNIAKIAHFAGLHYSYSLVA